MQQEKMMKTNQKKSRTELWGYFKRKKSLSTPESSKRRDYSRYLWRREEMLLAILQAGLVVIMLSYFFYRSIWATLILSVIGVMFFKEQERQKRENCVEELTIQFKECILSVAASLKAGYAVENAFMESREDMRLLYGENSLIYQELEVIRKGLIINVTLEEQLENLAERSGSEEIGQFAQVFSIAKRNGGSLPEIIHSSAELIRQRVDARLEVRTLLSGRKMEQTIMKLMPFAILGYIGFSYPGYFDSLYHNWQGVLIMTGCLAIYLVAYVWGNKILKKIEEELL